MHKIGRFIAVGPRGARYLCDSLVDVHTAKAKKASVRGGFPFEAFEATAPLRKGEFDVNPGDVVMTTAYFPTTRRVAIQALKDGAAARVPLDELVQNFSALESNPPVPRAVQVRAVGLEKRGYDPARAYAVAWSIHCKHDHPRSAGCQRIRSDYLRNPHVNWLKEGPESLGLLWHGRSAQEGSPLVVLRVLLIDPSFPVAEPWDIESLPGPAVAEISLRKTNPVTQGQCYDGLVVHSVAVADRYRGTGLGRFLYDIAGYLAYPQPILASRDQVSIFARRVWGTIRERDYAYRHFYLDDFEDPMTPPPEDDCILHLEADLDLAYKQSPAFSKKIRSAVVQMEQTGAETQERWIATFSPDDPFPMAPTWDESTHFGNMEEDLHMNLQSAMNLLFKKVYEQVSTPHQMGIDAFS